MKNTRLGWVSVPIMVLILSVTGLLLALQSSVNEHVLWQSYFQTTSAQQYWRSVFAKLQSGAVASLPSACDGFCSPWASVQSWQSMQLDGDTLFVQVHHHDNYDAKRWCASLDKKLIYCAWQRDGQRSFAQLIR
ncbi:hypothetical protein [Marinomonas ostreistagni]|uniref:hypothetical protein n=1 Tax=Marinomonas ostreistagni TaxID=359209 RepID=UPI0019513FA2|nr:hypothetical protein [Marinomonas ostreistagni]MBM6549675.1 hypothetical protein [Marinomonas ostreistagni]